MQKILELQPKDFMKGLATGDYINDGLFKKMKGIDVFAQDSSGSSIEHGMYGLLKVGYKATDISDGVVVDDIIAMTKKNSDIYCYDYTGHLYKNTSSETTVLDSGNESSRGGSGGNKSIIIYKGKLHYFYDAGCGTYDFSSTFDNTAYTTDFKSGKHPCLIWDDKLYFGNNDYIGKIDNTTLDAKFLTISGGDIQDIEIFNNYMAILTIDETNDNEDISKLYLWDGYSDGANYEYIIYEKCTAIERYKNDLAIFGSNLMFFGNGSFNAVREIKETMADSIGIYQTASTRNMLYWVGKEDDNKYSLFSYGSPIDKIQKSIQSFIYDVPSLGDGAIINVDNNKNSFVIGGDNGLKKYTTGNYGGSIKTKNLKIGHTGLVKLALSFKTLTVNDGVKIILKDSNDNTITTSTISYSDDGAIGYKEWILATKPIDYLYIEIDWSDYTDSNLQIENIILYGNNTKRPA